MSAEEDIRPATPADLARISDLIDRSSLGSAVAWLESAGYRLDDWQAHVLDSWISADKWAAATEPEPVDAIEANVRERMRDGEPRTGHDYDDPTFPDCPHPWCGEHWHGLAITQRMWEMRQDEEIDPDYRYTTDDSEVLCPGSLFDGEFAPPAPPKREYYRPPTPPVIIDETHQLTSEGIEALRQAMSRTRGVSAMLFYSTTADDSTGVNTMSDEEGTE